MIFRADIDGKVPPASAPERKGAMRRLVLAGVPVGLLAYADGAPIGWCSVAPRATFRGLDVVGEDDDAIWSLTCFCVDSQHRRQRVAHQLLAGAIGEARANGAKILEAYAVEPDSPSYRFGGFISFFTKAGFREVGLLGARRHVMRKTLRGRRRAAK